MLYYVCRYGARGAEREIYSEAFACGRFLGVRFGVYVDGLFVDSSASE